MVRAGLTAGLAAIAVGCGPDAGEGLFGDYNAKVVVQSPDVLLSRENVRTIVERNHGGSLDKEFTDTDVGVFDFTEQSVLTFRVPADQFDAAIEQLEDDSIGVVDIREKKGTDEISKRSDISQVYDVLKNLTSTDDPEDVRNAQKQLKELADRANRPVLIVDISPRPDLFDYGFGLVFSRLIWVALAFGGGFFVASRRNAITNTQLAGDVEAIKHREAVIAQEAADKAARIAAKKVATALIAEFDDLRDVIDDVAADGDTEADRQRRRDRRSRKGERGGGDDDAGGDGIDGDDSDGDDDGSNGTPNGGYPPRPPQGDGPDTLIEERIVPPGVI